MSEVKILSVSKSFDKRKVLNNININIKDGELISLLGPSGCGKSTTLKLIAGLLNPEEGDILFDNKSVLKLKTEKRDAVIVFQEYLLFPHMNIYENIAFGLKAKKMPKKDIDSRVSKLLEIIKLSSEKYKYPLELSGGQKQRIAIARALAINPKILLLDEPFSSLDINLRNEMREFVLEIQKKYNITTVLVTHDKEEALIMSDRIAVMLDGEIKQFDTPYNLYKNPKTKEVANIFGERNYIKGKLVNGIFKADNINIDLNNNESYEEIEIMISKEDIILDLVKENDTNMFTITKKRYAGDKTYYEVNCDEQKLKLSSNNDSLEIGENVRLKFNSNNIKYFHEK
ncbi:ABC transporter ATP-binding protein [Romboutsia lituseburensis]|uniref:ABC transporter ATP-binding protein n=1 Tax=Romboutsia lituseburensis TaxID=1537 RepID=UPI00215B4924|nr:ABC transporter ATP-binding protein [Romboutsia lituseburensis]MCR8746336.1 ABC transporter ATP-binding protein [Romboutsia lituseburensis]